jgi:hypothetical protein
MMEPCSSQKPAGHMHAALQGVHGWQGWQARAGWQGWQALVLDLNPKP